MTSVVKMTVDGDAFFLDAGQDVDEAKSKMVDAMQRGGGIVDVLVAGRSVVSVLVGRTVHVTFETVEGADVQPGLYLEEFSQWDELGL